jgi:hypothetical protein
MDHVSAIYQILVQEEYGGGVVSLRRSYLDMSYPGKMQSSANSGALNKPQHHQSLS